LSEDGRYGLTLIVFIGSVFSPYYAWAGWQRPENHCAFNIALYDGKKRYWAMTERRADRLETSPQCLRIDQSSLRFTPTALIADLHETSTPWRRPIRGRITIPLPASFGPFHDLDPHVRHQWRPLNPHMRVKIEMDEPRMHWTGHGYCDMNRGAEPLERAFRQWQWSRARLDQESIVFYDLLRRDGSRHALALRYHENGSMKAFTPPPLTRLPTSGWRMRRLTRSDRGAAATCLRTLEDSPFYTRSILDVPLFGQRAIAVHESLDLDRFRSPIVRAMLPFRMPRGQWWG
jgi:carotenoid 1,2-hydratase